MVAHCRFEAKGWQRFHLSLIHLERGRAHGVYSLDTIGIADSEVRIGYDLRVGVAEESPGLKLQDFEDSGHVNACLVGCCNSRPRC